MRLRFIHAADIHLGYEQYNLSARYNDFAEAYAGLVDHALERQVDFLLIAGDLFHRANADARTLAVAMHGLERLKDGGIPVVAIEGNHDAQHHRKHLSWMEFLCHQELLTLLNITVFDSGLKGLTPFDLSERAGSWIDVGGARIYGMKYYGAATARLIDEVAGDVEPGPYTIFMLHAGMQGQVPHLHGGLTPAQLEPLRTAGVNYLALGHVHKRLTDGWIFNPGSTEINSMEEIEWPHGFFEVAVDIESPDNPDITPISTPGLRPFRRISVHADGCRSVDDLVARVEEQVAAVDVPAGAVVELYLGGVVEFPRQNVPVEQLRSLVKSALLPLEARVRNAVAPPGGIPVTGRERMSRAELERRVIERLVAQEGEYRDGAERWTDLALDVKNMAREKQEPASIVDHVLDALRRFPTDEAVSPAPELSDADPSLEPEPSNADLSCSPVSASPVEAGESPPLFEDW